MRKLVSIFVIIIGLGALWSSPVVAQPYSRPISIINPGATTLSDYQVSITLDTASLVTAGKMLSTGADIRFSDVSATNLPYWIESGMNTASTVIWIKVNTVASSATTTIYMSYGNPLASAASNGDTTFDLFDDFTGTSLDLTKWTPHTSGTGSVTVAGGSVTFNTTSNDDASIVSISARPFPYVSEIRVNSASGSWPNLYQFNNGGYTNGAGLADAAGTMFLANSFSGCSAYGANTSFGSAPAGSLVGTWGVVRTAVSATTVWPGGTLTSSAIPAPTTNQQSAFGVLCAGIANLKVDWFRARQYYAAGTTQNVGPESTAATIAKAFAPTAIPSGGTSVVTLTLSNSNATTLTGGAFTDTLVNMSAVAGAVGGTCTGTMPSTLTAGQTALSFSGITIPVSSSCTVTFGVTSGTVGVQSNTTSGVTTTQTPTAGTASNTATLTVNLASQTITFNAQTPSNQTFSPNGTFAINPQATSATPNSGNPITYSSLTTGVCTISGTTVTMLSAGTCTIAADQAGNANYNAAPQATQNVAIGVASQTITNFIATPANPTFAPNGTFTVSAVGGASGNPVTFSIAAASASVCSAGGVNGATITMLDAGTCTVQANQAGNANYNAAPQATQNVAIGVASQTITFTSAPPTSPTVTGSYTVSATGGASGMPVVFSIDANSTAGACTVAGNVVTFTGAGTCTVDANQAGNANYAAAQQVQQTITVGKKTTTVSLVAAPNPLVIGQPVTLTATVAGDPPTGSVSFTDNGTTLSCSPATLVPGTTSSTASCTVTLTGVGSHSIVATYSGDGNFVGATSSALVVTVNSPPVAAPTLDRWTLLLLGGLLSASVFWRSRRADLHL